MSTDRETEAVAARARELLRYEPESGRVFWLTRRGNVSAGSRAGTQRVDGHWFVPLNNRPYALHRVVWLLYYGAWPSGLVDHIDRDPSNNRITNLRITDKSGNAQNSGTRSDNRTGFRGVGWCRIKKKFRARICISGKRQLLGYFDDPVAAAAAYVAAQETTHPFHPTGRLGLPPLKN